MQNYMELLVDEIFKEMEGNFKSMSTCEFTNLTHDIKAYALNNLTPMYFGSNTNPGEKKAYLLNTQRRISVAAKLAEGFNILCNNQNL